MTDATRLLVLDIEGTTTSISFVYDQLFPYARRELAPFVHARWSDPAVRAAAALMGADDSPEACVTRALALMDADVKDGGLKSLQGMIWVAGYASGELKGHLYPDVPIALDRAAERALPVAIYSSGSVPAQKLLFGHSEFGDLLPLIAAHFDTSTGPKKSPASYTAIAAHFDLPPAACAFLTDHPDEARAALEAGLQVFVALRPGNAPLPADHGFVTVSSLLELPALRG